MAKELVLSVGAEGGGADICRAPASDGGWRFIVSSGGMSLDENDDETWSYGRSDWYETLNDAIDSLSPNGMWVMLYPIKVHRDYRLLVWELVQKAAEHLSEGPQGPWERKKQLWQERCIGLVT